MDLRAAFRAKLKSLVVAVTCAVLAGLAGFSLWRDFEAGSGAGQGLPMAKIERRESRVKRKGKSSYVWSSVKVNDDLYRKDSVQTAEESAATIRLKDGSILEMGENSLVVIDEVGDLSLNFVAGQMVLRKDSSVSTVSVGADGKARIEQLPIRLVKPESLARVFIPEKGASPISLVWEATKRQTSPAQVKVQISSDRSFRSEITKSFDASGAGTEPLSVELEAGEFFWRVIDAGQDGRALSPVGRFKIAYANPLQPSWPVAGKSVVSFGDQGAVQFRWVALKTETDEQTSSEIEHRIQVSKTTSFKELLADQTIEPSSGVANLTGLPAGALHWRIVSRFGDLQVGSRLERFEVDRRNTLAIELKYPEDNGSVPAQKAMRFAWDAEASGVEYLWELARADSSVAQIITSTRSRASAAAWKSPVSGLYRWRVTAMLGGQKAGETQWRSLAVYAGAPIALEAPDKGAAIHYWDQPTEFSFDWKREDSQENFALDVAIDSDFKNIVSSVKSRSASVDSKQLALRPGSYFWRVRAIDENGRTLKTSETRALAFGPHPTLRAPAGLTPSPGHVFNPLEESSDPVLSWSKVDGAQAYEVSISLADSKSPGAKLVTKDNEVTVKNLKPGRYIYSVRSIDKLERRGEPSDVRPFTVTFGEVLPAPDVVSPEVQ